MNKTLEQIEMEIQAIDNRVKTITERPFRGEIYEEIRQKQVDELMDKRDLLAEERRQLKLIKEGN